MTEPDDVLPVSDLEAPRPSPMPRVLGLVVAVLLVAAVASVVFVGGEDRTPAERFAAIPAAVAEEPFAFELTFAMLSVPGAAEGTEPVELTMTGAVDPASKRTKAEMDMSAFLPAGMDLTSKISLVTDDRIAYVLVPAPPGSPPRWQKVDASALTQGAVGGLPSSTNPLDSFEQLRAVDAEIEDLGEEEVRGTTTTHYRTTLDMQKVVDALPAEQRPPAGSPSAELLASMEDVPVDVWLDSDDRPRRQRMAFSIPADAAGSRPAMKMTMQIEAFDFGTPVVIELPPADQVVEGTGLLGQPAS